MKRLMGGGVGAFLKLRGILGGVLTSVKKYSGRKVAYKLGKFCKSNDGAGNCAVGGGVVGGSGA